MSKNISAPNIVHAMDVHQQILFSIKNKIALLEATTGHVPLEPENQYCKYCGEALFTKYLPKCPDNPSFKGMYHES